MSNQPPPGPYGQPSDEGGQPAGQPQYPQPGQQYPPPPPGQYPAPGQPGYPPAGPGTNTMAIVSLVCSLAGLLVWISAPVGAVLGHISRRQIRERGEEGAGMALAGVIIGWVITGLGVLACCGLIGLVVLAESSA